ncbi:phosphotransferase [Cellvibrio sp. NN19]|uniref:phosphotransferase n=1 Tax=Cellvibrio chitinivorans TaxID=3102792 RepID=UPI002B402D54|nr:phosphotransferase [Cellvibrio sp. NN19]
MVQTILVGSTPFIAEWMSEKQINDRIEISRKIEPALKSKNYSINEIQYFQCGNTCVVAKILLSDRIRPIVVKAKIGDMNKEYEFFKATNELVETPEIIDYFSYFEVNFLVMSFFESCLLIDFSKSYLLKNQVFFELGRILNSVHKVNISGTTIPLFERKVRKKAFKSAISIASKSAISNSDIAFIQRAFSISGSRFDAVLCHGDLHDKNIFYHDTKISLIDPNPKINDRHFDIAFFLSAYVTAKRKHDIFKQILDGYREAGGNIDFEFLLYSYCMAIMIRICQYYKKGDELKVSIALTELRSLTSAVSFDKYSQ